MISFLTLVEKVSSGSLPLLDESLEEQSSSGVVDESPANIEAIDESFGGEISEQNISESKVHFRFHFITKNNYFFIRIQ